MNHNLFSKLNSHLYVAIRCIEMNPVSVVYVYYLESDGSFCLFHKLQRSLLRVTISYQTNKQNKKMAKVHGAQFAFLFISFSSSVSNLPLYRSSYEWVYGVSPITCFSMCSCSYRCMCRCACWCSSHMWSLRRCQRRMTHGRDFKHTIQSPSDKESTTVTNTMTTTGKEHHSIIIHTNKKKQNETIDTLAAPFDFPLSLSVNHTLLLTDDFQAKTRDLFFDYSTSTAQFHPNILCNKQCNRTKENKKKRKLRSSNRYMTITIP